ncbi:MAG: hypothetical protein PHV10_06790 [Sulfuricurvum sp.]|nr:hypothetical protein [Sulfuricurvum sp.]
MYSLKTKRIKLKKELFASSILWSIQDGDMVSINKIIAAYLTSLNQQDAFTLIKLFGEKRVLVVLSKLEKYTSAQDYQEAMDQIFYVLHPEEYRSRVPQKSVQDILSNLTQRDIDTLLLSMNGEEILAYAHELNLSGTHLYYLKQLIRFNKKIPL